MTRQSKNLLHMTQVVMAVPVAREDGLELGLLRHNSDRGLLVEEFGVMCFPIFYLIYMKNYR